jgi:hypothetical protein
MPEVLRKNGIRFFFYSNEHKPIHIHAKNADGRAKINLSGAVSVVENEGMKPKDLSEALSIAKENKEHLVAEWLRVFPEEAL